MKIRLAIMVLVVAAAALLPVAPAMACPVCWGASDSPMASGVNNGIFFMLAVVGAVQIGFAALFVSIRRRGKKFEEHKDSFEVINGGVR